MASLPVTEPHQTLGSRVPGMVLEVSLPVGMDPAVAESIKPKIEQALEFLMLAEQPAVIEQADRIAKLLLGKIEPNTDDRRKQLVHTDPMLGIAAPDTRALLLRKLEDLSK